MIKLFGDNYCASSDHLSRLSRESTLDSIDLIDSYTMAPSYSEAVLQDVSPLITTDTNAVSVVEGVDSDKNEQSVYIRTANRLRASLSRTSLRNGQILYFVSAINTENQNNIIRRLSQIENNDNTRADHNLTESESPPTYDEVVLEGHHLQPTVIGLTSMRRSITSGDNRFFRRLSDHFRRQWNSFGDVHLISNETQL